MEPKERLISWLNDAYAMENSIAQTLENHVKDARENPEMHSRLQAHLNETRAQAERLRDCIEQLGGSVSSAKSLFAQAMGKMQGVATGAFGDEILKNLLMDYSTEHFEMACYKSLMHAADLVGADNVLTMARQNFEEEKRMAEWLHAQIPPVTSRMVQEAVATA